LFALPDNKQVDVTVCVRCSVRIGSKKDDSLWSKLPDQFLQVRAEAVRYLVNRIVRIAEVILPDCRLRMFGTHESMLVRGGAFRKGERMKAKGERLKHERGSRASSVESRELLWELEARSWEMG
jgi:hypothetical protein